MSSITLKVQISNRPGASFPVRRMNFNFDDVPEYWMNESAGLTHFMTALSALFPAGEQLFIDSVRAVRYHPAIKDNKELQKEISAFIGQEAMHTHEHVGFNASAQKFGHDVAILEKNTDSVIQFGRKLFAKAMKPFGYTQEMIDLTATTALEHFTATIASELLTNPHIQELMKDDTMRYMWLWHAVEENGSVALVIAMSMILVTQAQFTLRLLKADKKLNLKELTMIYKFAYSPSKGIITGLAGEMLAYFRPRFHPNDLDTVALLDKWKSKLGL